MIMVCSQCGAPLEVAAGSSFARCQYCGVNVRLLPHTAPQAAVAQPPTSQPNARNAGPIIVVAASAIMAVMGAVASLVMVSPDKSLSPAPRPPPQLPTSAPASVAASVAATSAPDVPSRFSGPVCLLDANGDGVSDLLGMSGLRGNANQPTVVDGASGTLLWHGDARDKTPQLACLDSRWFVVVAPNFQAEFYDARNMGAPVRVLLRDTLDSYAMGAGCVRLRTSDRSLQGIALPGGNVVACETKAKFKNLREGGPGVINLTGSKATLEHEGRSYTLEKRKQGSGILSVRVAQGKKALWTRELPYISPTFDTGLTTNGRSIALWVAEPGAADKGILVGLDAETGEQRYAVRSPLMVSNSFRYFGYNGRFAVMQIWGSLHAYDPDTGALAWKIGD